MSTTHSPNDTPAIMAADADARYALAANRFGPALQRLASGYEWRPATREDLLQDIHLQLWRSLASFDGRCSLKTWVYRVAHNVAADHVRRSMRGSKVLSLEDLERAGNQVPVPSPEDEVSDRLTLARIHQLLRRLEPLDRQVMLLYLEGEDAAAIAEVTGLSAGAVATRIHRIKRLLANHFDRSASR
ncbi:MAG: sigma-70 family RNA polymerase sigma factor [Devosia sp.]|nr:sigma-70 family RNA polymerase sigma factor [Devosia sp.]